MAAQVISPRNGDTIGTVLGGNLAVFIAYDYAAASDLRAVVNTDLGPVSSLSGKGQKLSMVPCTLAGGKHTGMPVRATTNGVIDDTQTVTINIMAPPPPPQRNLTTATIASPREARPEPGTGSIQYILQNDFAPDVAYIVCAAHGLTANPAEPPVTVDGVFVRKCGGPSWAAPLTVPNNRGMVYIARIIEYDANDVELRKHTVVLD